MTTLRHAARQLPSAAVRRRSVVIGGAVAGAVLLAAPAFGYLTASGSGTGSGRAETIVALTLSPGTPRTALYPGGLTDLEVRITNPNRSQVRVGSLALETTEGTGGYSVDAGHAACAVSALTYTAQSNGGGGWTVSGQSDRTVVLSGALALSTAAADACQGATFTVSLKALP